MRRRRSLLYLMMGLVLIFLAVGSPISFLVGLFGLADLSVFLVALVAVGLGYGLNWLGRVQEAGYVFLGGIGLALAIGSWNYIGKSLVIVSFCYFALAACVALAGLIIDELAPIVVATTGLLVFSVIFIAYGYQSPNEVNIIVQTALYGTGLNYIMALMTWANARAINRALRQLSQQNNQLMAANTRLEQNFKLDTQLGDTIGQLSNDLSGISHDQSERAQSQAQSVAIITSTLEELSATARQVADVAEGVFTATEQALKTAEVGGRSVGSGIDTIATLTGQVESISEIANELGKQSQRISEIVETITELAEETNLLALNATIEAAGAGEYGRRFAVVASEVQLLANRSRAASRDVQVILGQIRTSITNTLLATDQGLEEAHRMSEVASQAGEAIEQIIETVESTTFLSRQIFLTTQQQRSATDQAVEMVRQVAGDALESAAHAQRLLSASDRLSQSAASLRRD